MLWNTLNSAFVVEKGRIAGRDAKVNPNEPGVAAGSDLPTLVKSAIRYGISIRNDADAAETDVMPI